MANTPLMAPFLIEIPIEDTRQKRLAALKAKIEEIRLAREKEQEKEEKRKKFISGLLGG